jgi:YbbR domain-containing protein
VSTAARKEPGESAAAPRLIPPATLKARYYEGMLKRGLRRNVGLRLISVLLAMGLWFFVNAGQHGSIESFNVPVTYRDLPPHMIITNPHPQSVKVEVSGPRTLLSLIDPGRLTLRLDLIGVTVGEVSLRVNPEAFNVPRQTTVVSVVPSQIVLDIDQITTRDLPVRLTLTGAPAMGYRVSSKEVDPPTTAVRGPGKELARIEEVESEPIDLTDATGSLGRRVALTAPFASARIEPAEVTANIGVAPIVEDKEFRGMPIEVRGNESPFRIEPAHVNLTIRGTQLELAKLDLHEAAFIDADGMPPGVYDATVQITLPEGVELVHQSAMKVKLRIYRERRTSRH